MSNSKSFSGSKENYCFECHCALSAKKVKECNDCNEKFCKSHIKTNEFDFSSICSSCFRNKIHLEVSMEMETQILDTKSQLKALKEKLKFSKKELNSIKTSIEKVENSLITNEKSHQRKSETLLKKTEEESKRADIMSNLVESLNDALTDCKFNEKSASEKLELSEREKIENQLELDILKHENNKIKCEILASSSKLKGAIQYDDIRNVLCRLCKVKIKKSLGEEIVKSNPTRESLVASVYAEKAKNSSRKSTSQHGNQNKAENDSCNCLIC